MEEICAQIGACAGVGYAVATYVVGHFWAVTSCLSLATEVTSTLYLPLLGAISFEGRVDGVVGGRELQGGRRSV